jgi:two-component system LytT family sensor kinase
MDCIVPVFTLQPIVENAIEHGTSQRVQQGIVSITASVQGNYLELVVKDNAGMYKQPEIESTGIGLTLDKRIKLMYGKKYGLSVDCKKNQWTKFTLQLPILHAVTDA